ncbi:hypothetical protein Lser_V15G41180 [Lactuca serriola]
MTEKRSCYPWKKKGKRRKRRMRNWNKNRWMNGLHSKALPMEELIKTVGDQWKSSDIPKESEGIFIEDTYKLLEGGVDVITDAERSL